MTELKILHRALGATLFLVVLFGTWTISSLFDPLHDPDVRTANDGRVPASFAGSPLMVAEGHTSELLHLTCTANEGEKLPGYNHQVRIEGDNCRDRSGHLLKTTWITNKTNGFNATIFAVSAGQFTTDYISLAKGENVIQIHQVAANGEIFERSVTLIY